MKFFNLYKNQLKFVCKSKSRIQLYNKYYKFKKKHYKPNNDNTINNQFLNYITVYNNKNQNKCRKLYQHNYYIKNRKRVILKISKKNNDDRIEKSNNRMLFNYHMNKEKVIKEKKKKKKESLILEWDFQNPCEK